VKTPLWWRILSDHLPKTNRPKSDATPQQTFAPDRDAILIEVLEAQPRPQDVGAIFETKIGTLRLARIAVPKMLRVSLRAPSTLNFAV